MSPPFPSAVEAGNSVPPRVTMVVAVLTLAGTAVAFVQSLLFPIVPLPPRLLDAPLTETAWVVTGALLCAALATTGDGTAR
ncbi:hypothetical protein OG949_35260 [Streptomyces scopuliridis]|uniref:hypothetical protein n=1 Tax=Streptomyces scopuliridis TaxID=452529 RepID=UPI002DDB45B0|nr:hypothetical protein [Streptomyces scopuliridis]WSB37568.1 hypothetical protein OG949_35260 [Streptomyces scopuliridis]